MPDPISMPDNGNPNLNTNRCFFMPTPINHGLNFPAGVILPFAGKVIPDGWLLCDGSAVSRTKYGMLFNTIGTTYGEGDGSTTFNLPNLVDKFIEGGNIETCGTEKEAGLPNITGTVTSWGMGQQNVSSGNFGYYSDNPHFNGALGVYSDNADAKKRGIGAASENNRALSTGFKLDASKSNTVYGKSTTVQPPAIQMCYIIRI